MSRRLGFAKCLAVALTLALAVLAGCSTVRLGYSQLDTLAQWTADRYFDLDDAQEEAFRARFRRLHEWHRYEQLPDYADFLAQAKLRLERGLTDQDVYWFLGGLQKRYAIIVERGTDDAAALLLTVTPRQLEFVQERWKRLNQSFAKEYRISADIDEQRHATERRTIEMCREWFGSLSVAQEHMIRASVARMEMIGPLRQQDRIRRQHEFLKLMQLRGDPPAFKEKFRHWLIHWDEGRLPEYQRAFAVSRGERIALLIALDRSLTPHQRALAAGRLQDYIDDFRALSAHPGAQATTTQQNPASRQ
jgi:hypothetical protein